MQYHLRTLLIALAIGPPLLAGAVWSWRSGMATRAQGRPACRPAFLQLGIALQKERPAEPAPTAPLRGER